MKTVLKTFLLYATAFVVLSMILFAIESAYYDTVRLPSGVPQTYHEFQKRRLPASSALKIPHPPDHICILGDQTPWYILSSGPPAYLFDPAGNLVDFTSDVGDSTKFQREYQVYEGEKISLDTLPARFGD